MSRFLPALLAFVVAGCSTGASVVDTCEPEGVTLDSGVQVRDLVCGTGEPAERGDSVTVSYVGRLADGERFDSTSERGEPLTFRLGVGQVIAGWDEGVAGMRVGAKRQLVIPPESAYDDVGLPPDVPPGGTVVYEIQLLRVRPPQE